MTNGSSQGLFTIVSVVIFGLFVALSYLLFQDKMNTGLSTIFCDGFIQSSNMSKLGKGTCGVNGGDSSDDEYSYGNDFSIERDNLEAMVKLKYTKDSENKINNLIRNTLMTYDFKKNTGEIIQGTANGTNYKGINTNSIYEENSMLMLSNYSTLFYQPKFNTQEYITNNIKKVADKKITTSDPIELTFKIRNKDNNESVEKVKEVRINGKTLPVVDNKVLLNKDPNNLDLNLTLDKFDFRKYSYDEPKKVYLSFFTGDRYYGYVDGHTYYEVYNEAKFTFIMEDGSKYKANIKVGFDFGVSSVVENK